MWPILALVGGALGTWWLLSGDKKRQPNTPGGSSGFDTVGLEVDDDIPEPYYVFAVEIDREDAKRGHYSHNEDRWIGETEIETIDESKEIYMSQQVFTNWNNAWEHYKALKAFFDENYKHWTCPPNSVGIYLALIKYTPKDPRFVMETVWWKCEEP